MPLLRGLSRAVFALGSFLAILAGVTVLRGLLVPVPAHVDPVRVELPVLPAPDSMATALAEAIRIATVGPEPGDSIHAAFRAWLARRYPATHRVTELEVLPGGGLLFRWPGSDPALAPLLLAAHLDVVPAEPGAWQVPPFAGMIREGEVWGRGARDDKGPLVALLGALEARARAGLAPARTVLLAIGHDEERGGDAGAAAIAAALTRRGVRPVLVLDEGLPLGDGLVPGVRERVALIGTAEKGVVTLVVEAHGVAGHSSMPAPLSSPARLARALERIRTQPMPAALRPPTGEMLDRLAPVMPLGRRIIIANRDWLAPLLVRGLSTTPAGNATVRTTVTPTMLEAGLAENVIPERAQATLSARLLPGSTIRGLVDHLTRVVDDTGVRIRVQRGAEPGDPSPASGMAWDALAGSVRATWPDALVAPALVVGATDGRHYERLGAPVYRFTPLPLSPASLPQLHGPDERIGVSDLEAATRFYAALLAVLAD